MNWRAFVATMLIPALVSAQSKSEEPQVVTYPPGDDKITVVRKGEAAPYAGQLFDDDTALRWAVWLKQYRARYVLDLKAEQDRCSVRVNYERELRAIEEAKNKQLMEDLKERVRAADAARLKAEEELKDPPFLKQPGVWFSIGVVSTVATSIVVAVLVSNTGQ